MVVPTLRLLVRLSAYIHQIFVTGYLVPVWPYDVYQLAETDLAFDNVVAMVDTTYY